MSLNKEIHSTYFVSGFIRNMKSEQVLDNNNNNNNINGYF